MIFQGRKQKWQQIQGEVAQEYDVVKNIMQTLALFKGTNKVENICLVHYLVRDCDLTKRTIKIKKNAYCFKGGETHDARQVGPGLRSFQAFEEPTRDPDVWPAPPPRDQWSQPPE